MNTAGGNFIIEWLGEEAITLDLMTTLLHSYDLDDSNISVNQPQH